MSVSVDSWDKQITQLRKIDKLEVSCIAIQNPDSFFYYVNT